LSWVPVEVNANTEKDDVNRTWKDFDSGEKRSVKFSGGRHRQRVTWENPEFIGPGRPEGKVILPTLIRNDA
jgi:hypothetical protein